MMGYGLTFDDVKKINVPYEAPQSWGGLTNCTKSSFYSLHRITLAPGRAQSLHFHPKGSGHIFVESGSVVFRTVNTDGVATAVSVAQGGVIALVPFQVYALSSAAGAVAYLAGEHVEMLRSVMVESAEQAEAATRVLAGRPISTGGISTTDIRDKYWGRIETILDGDVAAKRIFVAKDGQSSMEFHVEKRETYWIHSGRLKVGLRVGRAENRSIVLEAGQSYDILPGVMHMRIALEDTVIIEASTRDSDADSHLVEDGQTYRFIETPHSN